MLPALAYNEEGCPDGCKYLIMPLMKVPAPAQCKPSPPKCKPLATANASLWPLLLLLHCHCCFAASTSAAAAATPLPLDCCLLDFALLVLHGGGAAAALPLLSQSLQGDLMSVVPEMSWQQRVHALRGAFNGLKGLHEAGYVQ